MAGSEEISSPCTAAACVMIILITPISMPRVTGPALAWPACDHTRSASHDRYDLSARCRDRSSKLPGSQIYFCEVVSQRRTCRLYAGRRDRQASQCGRRRTCSVTGPDQHASPSGGPICGRHHDGERSRWRSGPLRLIWTWYLPEGSLPIVAISCALGVQ